MSDKSNKEPLYSTEDYGAAPTFTVCAGGIPPSAQKNKPEDVSLTIEEIAYRAEMANQKDVDWDYWKGLPSWTSSEAAKLLLMLNPEEQMTPDHFIRLERAASRGETKESPVDWVRWANEKGLPVPDELMPLYGGLQGLDAFKSMKNLTASKLTVRLLYKEGAKFPDRMELSANGKKRTVAFNKIGLASDNGKVIREGQMLLALAHGIIPQNMTPLSQAQAMTKLRKIFKGIGIMDKDPFHPKKANWEPRFTLIDARGQADKRAADRAVHVQYDDARQYD